MMVIVCERKGKELPWMSFWNGYQLKVAWMMSIRGSTSRVEDVFYQGRYGLHSARTTISRLKTDGSLGTSWLLRVMSSHHYFHVLHCKPTCSIQIENEMIWLARYMSQRSRFGRVLCLLVTVTFKTLDRMELDSYASYSIYIKPNDYNLKEGIAFGYGSSLRPMMLGSTKIPSSQGLYLGKTLNIKAQTNQRWTNRCWRRLKYLMNRTYGFLDTLKWNKVPQI